MTKLKNIREPFVSTTGTALKSLQERLEKHCGGDPWELGKNGDCVEWHGSITKGGYGSIYISKRRADHIGYPCSDEQVGIAIQTHRLIYMIEHGLIEDDNLVVMHSCDNRPCCSPYHLSLGTRADNHLDACEKGNMHPVDDSLVLPPVLPESDRNYLDDKELARFLLKIDGGETALLGDDCAEWNGNTSNGRQPHFHMGSIGWKMVPATRVALMHYTGFDASEKSVGIKRVCGNNKCVALAHLAPLKKYSRGKRFDPAGNPAILSIIETLNSTSSNALSKNHQFGTKGNTFKHTEYQRFVNAMGITGDWNECWEWTLGRNPAGYGRFCAERIGMDETKKHLAHRIAYELWNGPIPDELVVRHMCHNKSCVNPRHLKIGTPQDNKMDSYRDGAIKTFFSIEQMQEIIAYAYDRGWDPSKFSKQKLKPLARKLRREIAEMYGLEYDRKVQSTVNNLLGDRTFTFIERPWN